MDTSIKRIPEYLIPVCNAKANPKSTIVVSQNGNLRITVLFSRLFRIEYYPGDQSKVHAFEDRASQVFWYRNHPPPQFQSKVGDAQLELETEHLYLKYLGMESLSIHVKSCNNTWTYGDKSVGNLRGTCRTLDYTDGDVPLEQGLLSREGWVLVDDSTSLMMGDNGIPVPRNSPQGYLDLYFFGYGTEFSECLRDFRALTGAVPLVPRYILGNWWSRFWNYSQQDIIDLIGDFEKNDLPLSVFIFDMDWHIVVHEKNKTSDGWTGYTWNDKQFPDYKTLINYIHAKGLRTSLNLHPASGVHPHEQQYPLFIKAMGLDPSHTEPVPFDCSDPIFVKAYFELLHHPYEKDGIDFWWLDWQQGTKTKVDGLDPLWILNHLHFHDSGRDGIHRPFIFSRWGGLGSHRYPIGFSGDTKATWKSLSFQTYFTSTASNIGFGWWSHDIGGHYDGEVDYPELYLRWVQYGLFSPILRLHSGNNFFSERRPFAFDAEIFRISRFALQFRNALIPYLYTCAWLDSKDGITLIRPLYHICPKEEAAYHFPGTYTFGTQLIVAPHTSPMDYHTKLARNVIWLPPGNWYNFFSGEYFPGGHVHTIYGDLENIPLFARDGAIIPLSETRGWTGKSAGEIPENLRVFVFPGNENTFEMYEDDGETVEYKKGKYRVTKFDLKVESGKINFSLMTHSELLEVGPLSRNYEILFHGIDYPKNISVIKSNETEISYKTNYEVKTKVLTIIIRDVEMKYGFNIIMDGIWVPIHESKFDKCLKLLKSFRLNVSVKKSIYDILQNIIDNPSLLLKFTTSLSNTQIQALFETIQQCGIHHIHIGHINSLIIWNNSPYSEKDMSSVIYTLSASNLKWKPKSERYFLEHGSLPLFKAHDVVNEFRNENWRLVLNYYGGFVCKLEHVK